MAPESLSLCVLKEKVTKEKEYPAWRLPPIHGRQVREPGPGFSTGLLSGRKGIDIHVDARCAAYRPRLTAAQGTPGRAAGHRDPHSVVKLTSNSHSKATLCCCALDLALLKSARRMRAALQGPLCSGGRAEEKPEGWFAWMRTSLSPGQDALSTNPVAWPRTLWAGCPQGAETGCRFLLGTSLLDKQKRSTSPSEGGRTLLPLLLIANQQTSRPPGGEPKCACAIPLRSPIATQARQS